MSWAKSTFGPGALDAAEVPMRRTQGETTTQPRATLLTRITAWYHAHRIRYRVLDEKEGCGGWGLGGAGSGLAPVTSTRSRRFRADVGPWRGRGSSSRGIGMRRIGALEYWTGGSRVEGRG